MASSSEPLIVDRSHLPALVLRLNRPDRLNAVSGPLYDGLLSALDAAESSSDVRVVVLTGTGRAFCAGADLKAHGDNLHDADGRRAYVQLAQKVNRRLQTIEKPVVAAVNGHAIGAGFELALSCDFIIVADQAKLRLPEVGLGTFVGGGVVYTLAQQVGPAKARELIMLGEFVLGSYAVAMGLAMESVPADQVLARSLDLARRLAAKAPISMALAKNLLRAAQDESQERLLEREADALLRCMETRDWQEGIAAFREKREPRFVGE